MPRHRTCQCAWRARADGDEARAAQFENTAQAFATQLVSAEQSMEDLKTLHDQALSAAGQAIRSQPLSARIRPASGNDASWPIRSPIRPTGVSATTQASPAVAQARSASVRWILR